MIKANDPSIKTWLQVKDGSDFPIQNIPFGIFKPFNRTNPRAGTRIGDHVIDLAAIAEKGYFKDIEIESGEVFYQSSLNDFIALGKPVWQAVRERISDIFNHANEEIWRTEDFTDGIFYDISEVEMLMPVEPGDLTDFYSSLEHATNIGKLFGNPKDPIPENWRYMPLGYHGKASSVVVSGTSVRRPLGQIQLYEDETPDFGPSHQMDFELEMAFISGGKTRPGERIPIDHAADFIFGLVLFNDLSARDIQQWEQNPLGPFLSKSFGSVISPWVVTLDALEPFRVEGPEQEPEVFSYLSYSHPGNFNIRLEALMAPEGEEPHRICRSNAKFIYWNIFQQLTHQTVNGCNINVGDLFATGTISGPTHGAFGSMLELTWNGRKPIVLPNGEHRKYLNDNDTIIIRGHAENEKVRIGFGEAVTKILPAVEFE
jgi:fumarylacetoacetase